MLSREDRSRIERVKEARAILVRINEGTDEELTIVARPGVRDIKKLTHDIALALQDYLNINGR